MAPSFELYGFLFVFLLGLRHGLDPDHIAVIDGISYQQIRQQSRWAPWVGTLFALGHGLMITVLTVLISRGKNLFRLSEANKNWLEWIPVLLLLLTAILNLNFLLSGGHQKRKWRHRGISASMCQSAKPVYLLLMGVMFTLVFDTATQLAAWSYTAGNSQSSWHALGLGIVFTAGMVLTDTVEGRLLYRISRTMNGNNAVSCYRRRLGWMVVFSAFSMAFYKAAVHLAPGWELGDGGNLVAGGLMIALVLCTYVQAYFKIQKQRLTHGH